MNTFKRDFKNWKPGKSKKSLFIIHTIEVIMLCLVSIFLGLLLGFGALFL